ncbi:hypothetical protein BDZ89DRAFT_639220 [Hymenopellis radicata]|nr:hypothetical protein BDZ89DRAFT_639220 [Hymenopellis radicata]
MSCIFCRSLYQRRMMILRNWWIWSRALMKVAFTFITDSEGRKVDFKQPWQRHPRPPTACTEDGHTRILEKRFLSVPRPTPTRTSEATRYDARLQYALEGIHTPSRRSLVEGRCRAIEGMQVGVDDTACNLLSKQGYSQVYGVRAIARVVRTDVLFPLAQKLLKGTIRDSDIVVIREAKTKRRKTIIQAR